MHFKLLFALITTVVLSGCDKGPEEHSIESGGTEWGVRIVVQLADEGETATLVCPKFNSQPLGAHGRECYLEHYTRRY